jgi:site-specific DNA recombinase
VSGVVPLHERPAGRKLLEDAREGRFDTVLTYRLDRIARTQLGLLDAADRLERAGVALRSATESFETATPQGRLLFQLLGSFSEFERGSIKQRTQDGYHRALRDGKRPGRLPYAYDIDENGEFVIVEDEARIVAQIIENIAGGSTCYAEARCLNAEGVPSPG